MRGELPWAPDTHLRKGHSGRGWGQEQPEGGIGTRRRKTGVWSRELFPPPSQSHPVHGGNQSSDLDSADCPPDEAQSTFRVNFLTLWHGLLPKKAWRETMSLGGQGSGFTCSSTSVGYINLSRLISEPRVPICEMETIMASPLEDCVSSCMCWSYSREIMPCNDKHSDTTHQRH